MMIKPKEAEVIWLTPKQALELLDTYTDGKKKRVHTMESMGFLGIMGCSMNLSEVKKLFKVAQADDICLSGKHMRGINHGVAVYRENKGWLFISTDEEKVKKFEKSLV